MALLFSVVATLLYFDVLHRLFPDSMTITVTSKGTSERYHLGCKPTSGNLPNAATACQAMRYLFADHEALGIGSVDPNRRCGGGPIVKLDGRYHYQGLGFTVDLSCPLTEPQRAFWTRIAGLTTLARLGPDPEKPYHPTLTRFLYGASAFCLGLAVAFATGLLKPPRIRWTRPV